MGSPLLVTTWFGSFLLEDGEVREQALFPKDPGALVERLATVREGGRLDEEEALASKVDEVLVPSRRLLGLSNAATGPRTRVYLDPEPHGYDASLLHETLHALAEQTVREALADKTLHLMQAISYLDEAHEVENLLGERLVAWYELHAPEVVARCEDHLELAKLIAEHGSGAEIREAEGWGEDVLGSELADRERQAVEGLAVSLVRQAESRAPLEAYVESAAEEIAPNISKLCGPKIAAKLIHHAGGLMELAKSSAGTIQMLGAEKAVFAHLVEGAPPPKHGVIYQHPLVFQAHPKDRGSISRALAAKIAIAARADAFTGNNIASELKAEVEARAEEVARVGRRRAMQRRKGGKGNGSAKGKGKRGGR